MRRVAACLLPLIALGCATPAQGIRVEQAPLTSGRAAVVGFPLHHLDARSTADALEAILPPEPAWKLWIDAEANLLFLDATPEVRERVQMLLVGCSDPPDQVVDVVWISNRLAAQVLPAARAAAPSGVQVIVDEATNALVLSGPLDWDPRPLRRRILGFDVHGRMLR